MDARAATTAPQATLLSDYRPPSHTVTNVSLLFQLHDGRTLVEAQVDYEAVDGATELCLDGDPDCTIITIDLDGKRLDPSDYDKGSDSLTLHDLPDHFRLTIVTEIEPEKNTRLEGLYRSSGMFCTQCEAEGFRRITWFMDRPDVMAPYTVRIEAEQRSCPVLLSNGNLVDQGILGEGRHYAVWKDPYAKPSYLFALVAGNLGHIEDHFITASDRRVVLRIYATQADLPRCTHAMESLKRAMKWDEEVYGLEYDLDIYNIVAVSDFNMGAMENKSLNLFNTKYVLADPAVATDADFEHVEGVIAHEYFHNWTGNRVTCRDWFQLSLKEGLTVFRDQEFSSDMGSRAVKRLNDVRVLRQFQFPEDAGPMAHPVRPEKYIEINNFYTATVYNKGAEVIRMMHGLLGPVAYRKGIDLYFERHDGQAVTCEDFVKAMEDASGIDLSQFRLWYSQFGTPELKVSSRYDAKDATFSLTVSQQPVRNREQPAPKPMVIPLRIALIGDNGSAMDVSLDGGLPASEHLLQVTEAEQTFQFTGVAGRVVPSLLRGFSAPVKLKSDLSREDRLFLLSHDDDPFARWEAGQDLATDIILSLVADRAAGKALEMDEAFVQAVGGALDDANSDPAMVAEAISLPSESMLAQQMNQVDVDGIHAARQFVKAQLGQKLEDRFSTLYDKLACGAYQWTQEDSAKRRLRNAALDYLMATGSDMARKRAASHYSQADNMTDRAAALGCLTHLDDPVRDRCFDDFYGRFKGEPLALDRWFGLQAITVRDDAIAQVKTLMDHADFSLRNPNRFRSLIGSFAVGNQVRFHSPDGAGYQLLADVLARLDAINPQTAARMVAPLSRWQPFDPERQGLMKAALKTLLETPDLSPDMYEIVSRALDQ